MTIEDLKGKISSLLDQYERESGNLSIIGCIIIDPSNSDIFYEWNGESFQEESAQNIGQKILNSAGVETKVNWGDIDSAPKDGTPILIDFGSAGIHRVFWSDDLWCVTDNKYDDRPLRCWRFEDIKGWMPLPESRE